MRTSIFALLAMITFSGCGSEDTFERETSRTPSTDVVEIQVSSTLEERSMKAPMFVDLYHHKCPSRIFFLEHKVAEEDFTEQRYLGSMTGRRYIHVRDAGDGRGHVDYIECYQQRTPE